jgi:TonB family protein
MRHFAACVLFLCLVAPSLRLASAEPAPRVAVRSAVAPIYPPLALSANVSGNAEVMVTVDNAGDVTDAAFLAGNQLLHEAAIAAAKRWKFQGANRETKVQLTFVFRMMPKKTPPEDMTPVFMPPYKLEVKGKLPNPTVNYGPRARTPTMH